MKGGLHFEIDPYHAPRGSAFLAGVERPPSTRKRYQCLMIS